MRSTGSTSSGRAWRRCGGRTAAGLRGGHLRGRALIPPRAERDGGHRWRCKDCVHSGRLIPAKTERDRIMTAYAEQYPEYGFERHFGYSTPEHFQALGKARTLPDPSPSSARESGRSAMSGSRRVGSEAEDQAADYLIEQGYTIVTRRWFEGWRVRPGCSRRRDARLRRVKSRSGRWYTPEEAINDGKVKHFIEAVERYCHATEQEGRPVRYDVIAIDDKGLRHYIDAFRAG